VHVDRDWVRENLVRLFPVDPPMRHLRRAAWSTYLMYAGLYDSVFDVLRVLYLDQVRSLTAVETAKSEPDEVAKRLAEHIIVLYARGKASLAKDDLVDVFFRSAPAALTASAMDFMGRSLNTDKDLDEKLPELLRRLWEWRETQTGGLAVMPEGELIAFAWWFASGCFPLGWALDRLEPAIERAGVGDATLHVVQELLRVFPEAPVRSLTCFRLLAERREDFWVFQPRPDQPAWRILEQGLTHEVDAVRESAEEITHLLGSMGYLGYRELLRRK